MRVCFCVVEGRVLCRGWRCRLTGGGVRLGRCEVELKGGWREGEDAKIIELGLKS